LLFCEAAAIEKAWMAYRICVMSIQEPSSALR
jgi:hypothetical protein